MGAILSNWVKSKAFSVSIRAMSFWVRFWYTYNGWIVIFFAMYTCFSFLSSNSLYKFSIYEIKWLIDFNFSLWFTQNRFKQQNKTLRFWPNTMKINLNLQSLSIITAQVSGSNNVHSVDNLLVDTKQHTKCMFSIAAIWQKQEYFTLIPGSYGCPTIFDVPRSQSSNHLAIICHTLAILATEAVSSRQNISLF